MKNILVNSLIFWLTKRDDWSGHTLARAINASVNSATPRHSALHRFPDLATEAAPFFACCGAS